MIYREGFQAKRRYLIKRMILKLNVLISLDEFDFLSVTFLHSSLSRLSTSSTHKSFGYIPAMTLHFLHGFLVSFHCLGVLLFCCMPCHGTVDCYGSHVLAVCRSPPPLPPPPAAKVDMHRSFSVVGRRSPDALAHPSPFVRRRPAVREE